MSRAGADLETRRYILASFSADCTRRKDKPWFQSLWLAWDRCSYVRDQLHGPDHARVHDGYHAADHIQSDTKRYFSISILPRDSPDYIDCTDFDRTRWYSVDSYYSFGCNCILGPSFVEQAAGCTEHLVDCTCVGCTIAPIVAVDTAASRLDSPAGPYKTRFGSFFKL